METRQDELKIRAFRFQDDYPEVCEWWRARQWRYMPMDHLGPLGMMVEDEKHKYCAAWVINSYTKWAWLEFLVSNPTAPLKRKKRALQMMIEEAKAWAVENKKTLFCVLKNKNLVELYKEHGFSENELGATSMTFKGGA